jgi:glycosyltransferase involved in cell wall biosynthesis
MVTTIHGFSGPNILPAYRRASSHFVAISNADRSPDLPYIGTVYHGIDLSALPDPSVGSYARQDGPAPHTTQATPSVGSYARQDGPAPHTTQAEPKRGEPRPPGGLQSPQSDSDHLICFGRIHPDKGTDIAIEIARRAGRRLVLCGIVQDQQFFESAVAPHIDGDRVTYLGSVGPDQRGKILSAGAALLHPIRFAEPFGLSVVEAMACGTPVIAYRKGSMPEVVDSGVTGLLVENSDEAVAAVGAIGGIDRIACARRARERFSAERMVDDYLAIYRKIVAE